MIHPEFSHNLKIRFREVQRNASVTGKGESAEGGQPSAWGFGGKPPIFSPPLPARAAGAKLSSTVQFCELLKKFGMTHAEEIEELHSILNVDGVG